MSVLGTVLFVIFSQVHISRPPAVRQFNSCVPILKIYTCCSPVSSINLFGQLSKAQSLPICFLPPCLYVEKIYINVGVTLQVDYSSQRQKIRSQGSTPLLIFGTGSRLCSFARSTNFCKSSAVNMCLFVMSAGSQAKLSSGTWNMTMACNVA